ncbi:MAG: hypothetical protein IT370_08740 [Deltaproteobacteria bacterium]|nr:hypothetical protein [Deltaproteobacteria bacterium]
MAFDEEDMKALSKIINTAISDRLDRAEKKQGEAMAKMLEDVVGAKLAEATKAQADAAAKPNPEAEERKTLTQRVKELEKERDDARQSAKQERTNTAFRKAWTGAKFLPDLADEHMALLDKTGRLVLEDDGTVRVRDPKKHKDETQPTLDEYVSDLAKSDRGKLYLAARTSSGQGATPANGTGGKREPIQNAVMGLLTGNIGE